MDYFAEKDATEYIEKFRTNRKNINTIWATYKNDVKNAKAEASSEYADAIAVMEEMYPILSQYVELVKEPNGTLLAYSLNANEYNSKLKDLSSKLEFAKP
jgi:disulfide oxidoreductase YuzD